MTVLILGLIVFLGVHSVRIVAAPWRARTIARIGPNAWKGAYSLLSLAGFALLVWGYGEARQQSALLYDPPPYTRHIAALLMLVSLVLLAASKLPHNYFKSRFGHPMLLGVKVWAFAHLIANGRVADVLLFGSFLLWAVVDYIAARRRDRAEGVVYPAADEMRTVLTVVAGVMLWALFVGGLHLWLFGVLPLL
jgi:uncharacterized membrane protein